MTSYFATPSIKRLSTCLSSFFVDKLKACYNRALTLVHRSGFPYYSQVKIQYNEDGNTTDSLCMDTPRYLRTARACHELRE
jgi:hypothetical protein